jgi:hypothetical protein
VIVAVAVITGTWVPTMGVATAVHAEIKSIEDNIKRAVETSIRELYVRAKIRFRHTWQEPRK